MFAPPGNLQPPNFPGPAYFPNRTKVQREVEAWRQFSKGVTCSVVRALAQDGCVYKIRKFQRGDEMKNNQLSKLLALWLWVVRSQCQGSRRKPPGAESRRPGGAGQGGPPGQKQRHGVISRDGDTITMSDQTVHRRCWFRAAPRSRRRKRNPFRGATVRSGTALPRFKRRGRGRGDSNGGLVADKIKFTEQSLNVAQTVRCASPRSRASRDD